MTITATAVITPEQRVLLHDITWKMYEELLEAQGDRPVPRFTYDKGALEIMSPSPDHELLKDGATLFVNIVAEELGINVIGYGSTTFRREDAERGFEPDACFYTDNITRVRGKKKIDLRIDPPPDLVIEIDITHPSLPKFPIFREFGVPEVWLHDGERLRFFRLTGTTYDERRESAALPGVTAEAATRFIEESRTQDRLPWLRDVRAWAREMHRE